MCAKIMKKSTTCLFCGYGALVIFLCLTKVSSAPNKPQNIIDTMKNDESLSSVQPFLYESNITNACHDEVYPINHLKSDSIKPKTFLCLVFYDTIYRYCKTNQSPKFNDKTTFDSHIQKLFPNETNSDKINFCKNMKPVKYSYKKLEILLQNTQIDNDIVCNTCFDGENKFVPLCGILAWHKNLTDEMEHTSKPEEPNMKTKAHNNEQEANSQDSSIKTVNIPTKGTTANITKNSDESTNSQPTEKKDTSKILQISTVNKEKFPNREDVKDVNIQVTTLANTDIKSNENEDNKQIAISKNTQDHEDSANQEDDIGEDKFPIDTNDVADRPLDAADQSQNIMEPVEKDNIIPRYHSIRPDEESHFFNYFTIISLIAIVAYIGYHNNKKILAFILEGQRSRNSRGRRRPSTANYRKLDCTLEEAVTSQCNANVTHVIY